MSAHASPPSTSSLCGRWLRAARESWIAMVIFAASLRNAGTF